MYTQCFYKPDYTTDGDQVNSYNITDTIQSNKGA